MPNKRFLGLGFSFTATDNGLEKKLTSISSILSDISGELDDVNSKFGKMGQLFKGTQKSKSGNARPANRASGGRPAKTRQSKMDQVIPVHVMNFSELKKGTFVTTGTKTPMKTDSSNRKIFIDAEEDLNVLSANSHKAFKDIEKELGAHNVSFRSAIEGSQFEIDKFGNFTEDSIFKLSQAAKTTSSSFVKAQKEGESLRKKIELVFGTFKEYLNDVGENAHNFLSTLGLNLKELIPPQISAAFKLVKSVLAGPAKLMKSLIMKPFQKKKEEKKSETDKNIRKILFHAQQTNMKLGKNTKTDSIFAKTEELVDIEKDKKDKPGLFGKIGDFLKKLLFSPFTLIATAAGLLWKGFKMLMNPLDTIGKLFNLIKSPLKFVSELFGEFAEYLGMGAGEMAAVAAAFVAAGAAIFGFVKGIMKTKEDWKTFFNGIFDLGKSIFNLTKAVFDKLIGKLGEVISDFLSAHPAVQSLVDGISGVAKSIGDALSTAFKYIIDAAMNFGKMLFDLPVTLIKMIADGWENIAGWLGTGAGLLGKTFTGLSKQVDMITKGVQTPMKTPDQKDMIQPINPTPPPPKAFDFSDATQKAFMDAPLDSKESRDAMLMMAQELKEHRRALQENTDTLNKNAVAPAPVQVNVNSDARKQGIFLQKVETEAHGFAGS